MVLQPSNSSIYRQLFSWESQHPLLPVETAPSHEKAAATKTTSARVVGNSLGQRRQWSETKHVGMETVHSSFRRDDDGRCNYLGVKICVSTFRWTFETHGVSNFSLGSAGTPTKSCESKRFRRSVAKRFRRGRFANPIETGGPPKMIHSPSTCG